MRTAIVVLVAAGALLVGVVRLRDRGAPSATADTGVVVVRGGAGANEPDRAALTPSARPDARASLLSALQLPPTASFKEKVPADGPASIVCGEVSVDGRRSYRRFVYNRAAATGAVDDGTPLFRRFADKICLQQR